MSLKQASGQVYEQDKARGQGVFNVCLPHTFIPSLTEEKENNGENRWTDHDAKKDENEGDLFITLLRVNLDFRPVCCSFALLLSSVGSVACIPSSSLCKKEKPPTA